jgi:hypothetical protein
MTLETFATRSLIAVAGLSCLWLFFYQPESNRSSFTHSGTQPYIKTIAIKGWMQ